MPQTISTEVFQFDELEDRAKQRARDWYRTGGFDYEWWDSTFEDAKQCLALAGFDVEKIYFSGFSSQGDGACFEGSWRASDAKPVKAMKQHAPLDKELHRIASEARAFAKAHKGASLGVKHRGQYCHEFATDFSVDLGGEDDIARSPAEWDIKAADDAKIEEEIVEISRNAMRWIYRQLEKEYDYMNSDEQIDETIRANEYTFTAEGKRFG